MDFLIIVSIAVECLFQDTYSNSYTLHVITEGLCSRTIVEVLGPLEYDTNQGPYTRE